MIHFLKNKPGLSICITSLIFLFLLKLPLNLSVVCANENQGFAFTWGQNLLLWQQLAPGRGPLFVFLYAIVLKLFGFNTWAIIAIHFLETIISVLIAIALYLIVSSILKSTIFGGLSVLFWVELVSTPIGASTLPIEIQSHHNLNEENLCVFFSLYSILCLALSNFFNDKKYKTKDRIYSFLAGVLATCSFMSKSSGAILFIALFFWFSQLFFFNNEHFKHLKNRIIFCCFGILLGLILLNIIFYLFHGDLIQAWKDYFLIGMYRSTHLASFKSLFGSFLSFMTRSTYSISNFILFSIALLLFFYGLLNRAFITNKGDVNYLFWTLISIWGLGNICVIIAPGEYQPYYYYLIWPQLAIVFSIGLQRIVPFLSSLSKKMTVCMIFLICLFFFHRLVISAPAHFKLVEELINVSIFNQLQSFQDPVLPYDRQGVNRPGFLQLADGVNALLPNKDGTLYIFNFDRKMTPSAFTPLTYIYAKRYPPTTVDASLLAIPNIIGSKLKVLKQELISKPPEVLIVSKNIFLEPWQAKYLPDFLEWFSIFVSNNYKFETTFSYQELINVNEITDYFVYRKLNTLSH